MFSKSLKKRVAVLLTGVMVLGMTVTAFAGETTGNGGSNGTGNFEGHVNRDVVEVVLPTIPEDTTPFSFIYDPEGLIAESSAAAYGADYASAFEAGKYVWFKTDDKEFKDTSKELTVSNNSAVSVNVVLQIDVVEKDGQAKLAKGALPHDYDSTHASGDPTIKLDLITSGTVMNVAGYDKVGTDGVSENQVIKSFCVAGHPEKYSVSADSVYGEGNYPHSYTFKKNENATGFDTVSFKLQAAANKVENAKGVTAPDLKVTWKYEPVGEIETDEESGGGSGSGGSSSSEIAAYMNIEKKGENNYILISPSSSTTFEGLTAVSGITSFELKYNDGSYVSVKDKAIVNGGIVGVKYVDITSAIGISTFTSGDKITGKVVIDGKTYVATFTRP
jgi:hypothetical protein